jgi:hypothetical protein
MLSNLSYFFKVEIALVVVEIWVVVSLIIKQVPLLTSSLLLKKYFQDTQTLQLNYIGNYLQN